MEELDCFLDRESPRELSYYQSHHMQLYYYANDNRGIRWCTAIDSKDGVEIATPSTFYDKNGADRKACIYPDFYYFDDGIKMVNWPSDESLLVRFVIHIETARSQSIEKARSQSIEKGNAE